MRKGEKPQDFINGFLQGKTVFGRPCDIMKLDANSFLFTDDYSGIVYYVRKKDWKTQANAAKEVSDKVISTDTEKGKTKNETCISASAILLVLGAWAAKTKG